MQSRRRRTTNRVPVSVVWWRYFRWTSVCRVSICADNVRGSSIRPATFPTIRYHAPYPDTNSDNHSLALSLRSCASRIMYSYSHVYARTISLRSRDKYPRAATIAANSSEEVERHFCVSEALLLASLEFASSRPQPPDRNPSPAFVTRETHLQLFIAFTPLIPSSLVGSHAPMLHTRSNLAFVH